jgi:hypothetical protein
MIKDCILDRFTDADEVNCELTRKNDSEKGIALSRKTLPTFLQ